MSDSSPRALAWWPWACAVLAATAIALQVWQPLPATLLDWQPSLARQQPWRWWSAALQHWSLAHLLGNLAALCVLALLGWRLRLPGLAVLAWLAAWPLTHLALKLQPQWLHYAGMSGLLHAGVAVAAAWAVVAREPEVRRVGWFIVVGLAVKVLWEAPWRGGVIPIDGSWGVAALAHASGALTGLACACLALARGQDAPAPSAASSTEPASSTTASASATSPAAAPVAATDPPPAELPAVLPAVLPAALGATLAATVPASPRSGVSPEKL